MAGAGAAADVLGPVDAPLMAGADVLAPEAPEVDAPELTCEVEACGGCGRVE